MTSWAKKHWRERLWEREPDYARRFHLRLYQRCIVPRDPTKRELRDLLPQSVEARSQGAAVTELILAGYRQSTIARHYGLTDTRISQMHAVGARVFGYSLLGVLGVRRLSP